MFDVHKYVVTQKVQKNFLFNMVGKKNYCISAINNWQPDKIILVGSHIAQNIAETWQKYFQSFIAIEILT